MKGIFCIEGFWYGDHRDPTSVYPVLELIHRINGLPYIYHRCGTVEEFIFSIERWKTKAFHKKYPILYLAFHGDRGVIKVGKETITLEQLAGILGTKCEGVVIYFGSCATMNVNKRLLQRFLEQTRTLSILGFRQEVNWLRSASFDIQMLSYFLDNAFDSKGIEIIYNEIQANCKSLVRELDFRMEINEKIWFPRRRL
ncbi:MAG TPA: hypothetical protein PKC39_15855 [Ferruginibacter sp.]|nr:hypothetical protein [Ferruginibacter sp.]HMP22434.1 hypothetical protein [Ferruginibacter sp.]